MDDVRADEPTARSTNLSLWIFWLLGIGLLPLMLAASLDFGATWDEQARHQNGIRVFEYLVGLRDRDAAEGRGVIYPALFDVICVAAEKVFPQTDRYVLRHLVTATFGWIGILFCGRLAGRLFGRWAGILTLVMMAMSPRYLADSMNNPKDLPFAAMSVVALYYFSTISPRWPYISFSTGLKIALALAVGLSTRPVALLYLVGYLPMVLVALTLLGRTRAEGSLLVIDRHVEWNKLFDTVLRVAIVAIAVLLIGTLTWPWAKEAPLTRPFAALGEAAEYGWNGAVLFNNDDWPARDLPAYYLPMWFLIGTPPVVLAGMALSLVARGDRNSILFRLGLWGAALTPIALIIARNSTVYDAARHVLFVYPPMVAVAAAGWIAILRSDTRWIRHGALALLTVGLLNILIFNVRAYPNQAAYFNEVTGGPSGAFGKFDQDYWGNCMLQAVKWSAETAERARMPLTVWGNPNHLVWADAARFPQLAVAERQRDFHHLALRLNRGRAEGVRELAARPDALHRITTPDGAVLCVVLPGPNFEELHRRLMTVEGRSS
ncbi:MAG: hypothetical protein AB7F99_02990 [Vicinamibacterales bacterium]